MNFGIFNFRNLFSLISNHDVQINGSIQISWYMYVELDNASNTKIPPRTGLSKAVLYDKYSEINRPQDAVYYSLDTFLLFLFKK